MFKRPTAKTVTTFEFKYGVRYDYYDRNFKTNSVKLRWSTALSVKVHRYKLLVLPLYWRPQYHREYLV